MWRIENKNSPFIDPTEPKCLPVPVFSCSFFKKMFSRRKKRHNPVYGSKLGQNPGSGSKFNVPVLGSTTLIDTGTNYQYTVFRYALHKWIRCPDNSWPGLELARVFWPIFFIRGSWAPRSICPAIIRSLKVSRQYSRGRGFFKALKYPVLRSRWSRNYLGPGGGAEIKIFNKHYLQSVWRMLRWR